MILNSFFNIINKPFTKNNGVVVVYQFAPGLFTAKNALASVLKSIGGFGVTADTVHPLMVWLNDVAP